MSTAITNLRNRIVASKKAPGYNERMFVDAPTHELEAMLTERDDLLAALRLVLQCFEPDERRFYTQRLSGATCLAALNGARATIARVGD